MAATLVLQSCLTLQLKDFTFTKQIKDKKKTNRGETGSRQSWGMTIDKVLWQLCPRGLCVGVRFNKEYDADG